MAEVSTIVTAIKQYLQQTSEPSPQTWTAGNTLTFELGSFHQVWLLWHPGLKLPTSELWDRCPNHSAAKLLRFNTKKTDFNKWLTPWNWTLSRQMESKYANAFQENIGTCNCVFIPSSYKASLKKKNLPYFVHWSHGDCRHYCRPHSDAIDLSCSSFTLKFWQFYTWIRRHSKDSGQLRLRWHFLETWESFLTLRWYLLSIGP